MLNVKAMKIKLLLLAILCFTLSGVQAQQYLEMIEDGSYRVEEIVASAEAYFADKDKGRGSGYKQFKRWEYMANRLQNEQGYLMSVPDQLEELARHEAYLNSTAQNRGALNDNWQELGPDDWNATSAWSPGVGRVTGFSVDLNDNDHIIIGANTGGVWKTTDGGENWTPLSDYFSNLYVYSVTIDPNDSNTYYFGSYSGLIYKSTDAGATWTQIADLSNSLVNKILINPTDSDIIFACSQNAGVYRTTDGGENWTQVISGNAYDIEYKPDDLSIMYAGSQSVWRSTDGGASFSQVGSWDAEAKMIGVSADDPNVVYIIDEDNGGFGDLFKSTDAGLSFVNMGHSDRNYFGYDTSGFDSGGQAPRDMDIAVNPNNADEVHIAGILTWRSLDGGVSFTCTADWIPGQAAAAGRGYHHADVDIMEFIGNTLYVGSDGGIFKAVDTENLNPDYYEDLTKGLGIRQFYKIGVSQTEEVKVTGGSQDNGSSWYTEAIGWRDWLGADGMEGFIALSSNNLMFGTSQFGQLYRSTNGGNSYSGLSEPGQGQGNWVTPFEQDPAVNGTIYLGYNFVYKSVNNGNSWTSISQNFGANLDEMKVAPSNNQVIYASSGGLIWRTTDGGNSTWEQLTTPGGSINYISVHPSDPDRVAIATTSTLKVLVTEDGGQTWNTLRLNLPNFSALSVLWDDNGADGLYVGMNYGIYYIDDTFSEWQPFYNNLPNVIINELEINQADGKIYAGSYGRGLWATEKYDSQLAAQQFINESTVAMFPNPAIGEFTLMLPEPDQADIRVFNLAGQQLIYQADVDINGPHRVNISGLSAGMYFVRVSTGNGTVTKQLIVR